MLAVGVLEITVIFKRDSDIRIFLNGDVLLNGSWDGTLKWSRGRAVVVQGERHQRSLAIRTEDTATATGHVSKLCVKDCLSLKTFIPNFVAFFALLEIVIPCIRKSRSRSLRPNGSLRRPLFHYPPAGRWILSNYSPKWR